MKTKDIKNNYNLTPFHIALLVFQVIMLFFGIFLCVARLINGLTATGYVDCIVSLAALITTVWYVFHGYVKGEKMFDFNALMVALVILISTAVSTLHVKTPILVALSMLSFGFILVVINQKRGNKYRPILLTLTVILEFIIWLSAFFLFGEPGALAVNGDFFGFVDNIYMLVRFIIAEMLGLCYFAHERKKAQ